MCRGYLRLTAAARLDLGPRAKRPSMVPPPQWMPTGGGKRFEYMCRLVTRARTSNASFDTEPKPRSVRSPPGAANTRPLGIKKAEDLQGRGGGSLSQSLRDSPASTRRARTMSPSHPRPVHTPRHRSTRHCEHRKMREIDVQIKGRRERQRQDRRGKARREWSGNAQWPRTSSASPQPYLPKTSAPR